jgi:flagellar biosynthetic protein FliQ
MTIETIVGISRQTVELVLALAGPVLLAGLIVGLAVALFQAATQINEMTLTLIPKMLAVVVSLALFGPWMLQKLVSFTTVLIQELPTYVG